MEAPPVIPIESARRPRSAWWWILLVPALALAGVLFWFNPSQYGFYPRCALYMTTGLYCPGCGTQRCLHQLLHGNILAALRDNALVVLLLPVFVVYSARWVNRWLTNRPLPRFFLTPPQIFWFIAIVIVFTVLRNIHAAPFIYLAPQ